MATGRVKFFSSTKGFGFITPDDGGGDVFVRAEEASRAGLSTLDTGRKVSFEEVGTEGGKVSATQIIKVEGSTGI